MPPQRCVVPPVSRTCEDNKLLFSQASPMSSLVGLHPTDHHRTQNTKNRAIYVFYIQLFLSCMHIKKLSFNY